MLSPALCRRITLLPAIFAFVTFVPLCAYSAAVKAPDKNILIIYSNSPDFPVYPLMTNGFKGQTAKLERIKPEYYFEYLEWNRWSKDQDYPAFVTDFWRRKYRQKKIDLIVLFGDPAGYFMRTRAEKIFPGVPVIFAGNALLGFRETDFPANFVSLFATVDLKLSVETILRLQPATRKIYLILGNSEVERRRAAAAGEQLKTFAGRVDILFLNKLPFAKMLERIRTIEGNSVILFINYLQDLENNLYVPALILKTIHAAAPVPLYGTSDTFLESGSVGGYMTSSAAVGERAAILGTEMLLTGEMPNFRVETNSGSKYIFNWRELKRWGIDLRLLPEGSRIEFREVALWDAYKRHILGAIGLICLLVIIIVWLVVNRRIRRRAEEALQKSEEKFRELVENINDVHYELDEKGIIQYVSPSVEHIFGYSRTELTGRPISDFLVPEDTLTALKNIQNSMNGRTAPREYRVRTKSLDTRWIIVSSSPIRKGTQIVGIRGVLSDITGRKRAEEEKRILEERLQRAEKMESLGTLAGGVAHDLNNVLGVIVGYAELLLHMESKAVAIRPQLEEIMKGGHRAAAIVQDLLTLARRGVPTREILNLNGIVLDCRKLPEFAKLFSYNARLQVKIDLEPDLLNISGSPVHLGKTLFNLVSNASEAMPDGGTVTIRTANQYVDKPLEGYDVIREGDYVVLSVSDTGTGIAAADLKRIFEPFYTKKIMGRSGTGLGLAVVWGTVKDHQGYISVESEEGRGSVFSLYFPATREEVKEKTEALSVSEYVGKGESVLVVDDVKAQRDLAVLILEKLQYRVAGVGSGEEALAYLKEQGADLLVLDMIMEPGMDGLDTYKSILAINPEQKAVIVSGFSETERVREAQRLGAGAYVKKPYLLEKLGLAVRAELDKK